MRLRYAGALLGAVMAAPTSAQTMPLGDFLARADALQAKGAMALFSKDIGRLKGEVRAAGKQIRAEQAADQKAGRKPATCLPAEGKASVTSTEILAHFRAIPAARRGMSVKQAFASFARKRFPCAG